MGHYDAVLPADAGSPTPPTDPFDDDDDVLWGGPPQCADNAALAAADLGADDVAAAVGDAGEADADAYADADS